MSFTQRFRTLGAAVVATASLTGVVAVGGVLPAQAADRSIVDFTVAETLDGTPGEVVSDVGLEAFGCLGAEVTTTPGRVTTRGAFTRFVGTKDIDCTNGTLTLRYRAVVVGCSTSDFGFWRITGGTGDFTDARGRGVLVGTYTGGAGTACDNTGIDDNYTGVIRTR